jgi:hypothetical protein
MWVRRRRIRVFKNKHTFEVKQTVDATGLVEHGKKSRTDSVTCFEVPALASYLTGTRNDDQITAL